MFGNDQMLTYPRNKRLLFLLSWLIPIRRTSKSCFVTSTCISESGYPSGGLQYGTIKASDATLFAKQISPKTAGSRGCTVGQTWPFPLYLSFPETHHVVFVPKHDRSESHSMSVEQVPDTDVVKQGLLARRPWCTACWRDYISRLPGSTWGSGSCRVGENYAKTPTPPGLPSWPWQSERLKE